jgi:VWFA-related protein
MKPSAILQAVAGIAVLIAILAVPVLAQPAASTPVSKDSAITNDEVLLDIVVRDKKGKPVTDLKPQDLTVLDNGAKQELTGFRLVQGTEASTPGGAKVQLDPLRQMRLVTLVFETPSSLARTDSANNLQTDASKLSARPDASGDTSTSGAERRKIARTAALDFIKADLGGNVVYSVLAINTRLLVLQPFTADKAALSKAIERATAGVATAALVPESDAIKSELRSAAAASAGSDPNKSVLARTMLDMLRMDAPVIGMDSRLSISAFESVVQGLQSIPGRKSILYFTFGMNVTPELDVPFHNLIGLANHAHVAFYSLDTRGVSSVSQNSEAMSQLNSAAGAAAATLSNTGAVTRDQAMAADNAEVAARANVQIPLRELADSTGGFLIGDSNDLRGPLRQVGEEIASYYELSYNPGIKNYDGSFRKLKVDFSRKNLVAHVRSGYFALPAELRASGMKPFEVPLLKVISDGKFSEDVEFHSGAVLLRPRAEGTDLEILVEVPLHVLQPRIDEAKRTVNVHFSLAALVKNPGGDVIQKLTRDRSFQVTPDQLKMGNFVDKMSFTVPPGKYTLESALMDRESGKIGAQRSEFTVDTRGKGVGISSLTAVRSYTPNAKGLDPNEPFQFQGGSITPTLNTSVQRVENSALRLFFIVYQDPSISAKPAVEIEFIQNGKSLTKVPMPLPAADAQGRIPYVMTIPAAAIPPGSYEVRATARQGDSTSEARTTVKIEL